MVYNSSRITPLAPLDADRFRVAVTLVTAVALASESKPGSGNGSTSVMSASAAITQYRALFDADQFTVQPAPVAVTGSCRRAHRSRCPS